MTNAQTAERLARLAFAFAVSSPPTPIAIETVGGVEFSTSTVSSWVLLTIPHGAIFNRAAVLIEVPFNDPSATLKLGTSSDPTQFLRATDSSLSVAATYDSGELHVVGGDVLVLTLNVGTASIGNGYLFYRILNP